MPEIDNQLSMSDNTVILNILSASFYFWMGMVGSTWNSSMIPAVCGRLQWLDHSILGKNIFTDFQIPLQEETNVQGGNVTCVKYDVSMHQEKSWKGK